MGGLEVARGLHHVQGDLRAGGRADPVGDAQGLEHRVAARTVGPPFAAAPPPAAASVLAQVGGLKDEARATKQEHAGGTQALVHEGHRTLRARLGNGLPHEGLVLVGAGQLDQHNLIGSLRCRCRQPLFKLQHVLWGVRKGLREQGFKRGEWMREAIGGMMHQGKHRLGHLLRE